MDFSEVIKELEEEEANKAKRVTQQIFKSMLNQPSLVSINSVNAVKIGSQNGFSSFTADFARSILDVDTLQLVSTSIPQCNPSIPDTALTFWYYRLSNLTGTTPSLSNLYCARLLPSFYRPEFIANPQTCGFNKTFKTYPALATELSKITTRDIGYENLLSAQAEGYDTHQYFPFLPGDMSLTYNSTYNKFQMTGNNTKFAYQQWGGAEVTYSIGDVVVYENKAYVSLQNDNIEQNPATETEFWRLDTTIQVVPQWKATTPYKNGNLVSYNNNLYRYFGTGISYGTPPSFETDWYSGGSLSQTPYRYLITGYDDPNVAKMQGELFTLEWDASRYYLTGEKVKFQDHFFTATTETNLYVPGNVLPYNPATNYVAFDIWYRNNQFFRRDFFDTNTVPVFDFGTRYNQGDLVQFDSFIYQSLLDNNTENIPPDSPIWWSLYVPPIITQTLTPNEPQEEWSATTVYNFGDLVEYNGRVYKSIAINETGALPEWNDTTLYEAATEVIRSDRKYTAILRNRAVDPDVADVTLWYPGLNYLVGMPGYVVGVGAYVCIAPIAGSVITPNGDATHWQFVNGDPSVDFWWEDNGDIVLNLNKNPVTHPDYWELQAEHPFDAMPFLEGQTYPRYALAYYNNAVWIVTSTTTTTDPANWQFVGYAVWQTDETGLGTVTGLAGLTREHDFIIGRFVGEEVQPFPFPENIAGQPYNPNPKRLLNSILGFTWNAIFTPSLLSSAQFSNANQQVFIDRRGIELYNRLRPVPNYESEPPPEELLTALPLTPPATTTYTYTAEGYANLVYSSIVSIYTNVVGGATLDTMRDTNLLATTSMNCGNLGIAYHANYIDNPLLRVAGGDIDSIYIELRDEMGEPFYLTNNAVMTLTFKITYRERPRVE